MSGFKSLLSMGNIPGKGLKDEVIGSHIIAYATEIADEISVKIEELTEGDPAWDELQLAKARFQSFRWCYPLKLKPVDAVKCDRTRPLLGGPLFTSDDHPWPIRNGRYMEPIIQFYLQEVAEIEDAPLGEGLIQLWIGPDLEEFGSYLVRVIPSVEVAHNLIAKIPDAISEPYFEDSEFHAGCDAWPKATSKVYQISGVSDKVLSWDEWTTFVTEDCEYDDYYGDALRTRIQEFLEVLPGRLPATSPHFFGNFSSIQYQVSEVPRTLLALGSKPCFAWGDSGNAQIFYDDSDCGNVKFSFRWSTY